MLKWSDDLDDDWGTPSLGKLHITRVYPIYNLTMTQQNPNKNEWATIFVIWLHLVYGCTCILSHRWWHFCCLWQTYWSCIWHLTLCFDFQSWPLRFSVLVSWFKTRICQSTALGSKFWILFPLYRPMLSFFFSHCNIPFIFSGPMPGGHVTVVWIANKLPTVKAWIPNKAPSFAMLLPVTFKQKNNKTTVLDGFWLVFNDVKPQYWFFKLHYYPFVVQISVHHFPGQICSFDMVAIHIFSSLGTHKSEGKP